MHFQSKCFVDIDKFILNFIWKIEGLIIGKKKLKKENKLEESLFLMLRFTIKL